MVVIISVIIWVVLASLITAIIVSNITEARLKEATVHQLNDADDSPRWTAILRTKYRPQGPSYTPFECIVNITDAKGECKNIRGYFYGRNVGSAEAEATDGLNNLIAKALERAEAPALLIVRL